MGAADKRAVSVEAARRLWISERSVSPTAFALSCRQRTASTRHPQALSGVRLAHRRWDAMRPVLIADQRRSLQIRSALHRQHAERNGPSAVPGFKVAGASRPGSRPQLKKEIE